MAATDAADPVVFSNLSLHELFEQQVRNVLENADLDEEQKQSIMITMGCPCCGGGGRSLSVKLRPHSRDEAQRNPGRPRRKVKS